MSDLLLRFRPEFPILSRRTYLVSHSLGAMPRGAAQGLAEYGEKWGDLGVEAWKSDWWDLPVRLGDQIAPLMGAGAGEVVMVPNVSLAQAQVLSAVPFAPGRNEIVMTELDFPSVRYVCDALAPRFGARVTVVPSDDGISVAPERVMAAVSERTALVCISHVLFRSAYVMDVGAICADAHSKGALVSLDSFHAVGVIPVDVHDVGADFLTGGVLKWLCGGPGGAFLYVAPGVRGRLFPAITGWQAHARPFGFEGEMQYADGIWGWLNGTPAIPALYAAAAGPAIVRSAGIAEIRAKSVRQTGRVIEMALERGFRVNSPLQSGLRGGTVSVEPPRTTELYEHLIGAGILIDYRPGAGLRIAPHFYTSDEELDFLFAEVDNFLRTQP